MENNNSFYNRLQERCRLITDSSSQRLNAMLAPEFCGCDETDRSAVFRFRLQEWEKNQRGELHGGAAASMFDTAMGMTVLAFLGCSQAATADMSVSYIKPFTGGAFLFRTEILHPGRSLVRVRATAEDEETGKLLASATANFVYK